MYTLHTHLTEKKEMTRQLFRELFALELQLEQFLRLGILDQTEVDRFTITIDQIMETLLANYELNQFD